MHTAEVARRQGVGRAVLDHVVGVARQRGYRRLSLETGTVEGFAPARALYSDAGFTPCQPFGDYTQNRHSVYLSKGL